MLANEIAKTCPCPYAETIVKIDDGNRKVYHLEFGFRVVSLPDRPEQLGMVVIRGFGKEPMMLLTTEPVMKNRKVLWRLVRAYMRRWAIEETIRFIKQSYDLEDVRVLGYRSLQNLMQLVLTAAYFASVVLDMKVKLRVMAGHILNAAKRVFGIPDFHYYAIADGLTNIFKRHPGRIVITAPDRANQLPLFPD
ncbi:MAG: transposase [Nitrospirae bacterium]|nr:transposase [Nitrospirota bacterium]